MSSLGDEQDTFGSPLGPVVSVDTQEPFSEITPLISNNEGYGSIEAPPPESEIDDDGESVSRSENKDHKAATICLLLIGVFVANADSSLVLATNSAISSSFSQLQSASWLTTSYVMATSAAQPIVGKLSDIFGRKSVLLVCYGLFAVGSGLCGVGQDLWQVIAGRSIAGLGGAGMTVIVAVLITDLVPMIEVATWRSYVNVVATTGRMIGGPLGGWLADLIGWRWSFLGQVPLTILALLLVGWKLQGDIGIATHEGANGKASNNSKIRRVDFLGAFLLSTAIISFLLAVDFIGKLEPWKSASVLGSSIAVIVLIPTFFIVEAKLVREPIFPPQMLLKRVVTTTYLINLCQTAAQSAVMFSVPIYCQVVAGASNSAAGSGLVPAFVGNTFGALISGFYIKRTGRYKILTVSAAVVASAAYVTIIFRWRGHTYSWEALEILPGGFGSGTTAASTFIALTSNMAHENMAVATSGLFLSTSLGSVLGISISSGIQRVVLKSLLLKRLEVGGKDEVIGRILADVDFLKSLKGTLRETVIGCYIESLEYSHSFSLLCSIISFLVSLTIQERPLL